MCRWRICRLLALLLERRNAAHSRRRRHRRPRVLSDPAQHECALTDDDSRAPSAAAGSLNRPDPDAPPRISLRPYSQKAYVLYPFWTHKVSRLARARSSSTISLVNSSKEVFAVHPSWSRALLASPSSVSTSVGRK